MRFAALTGWLLRSSVVSRAPDRLQSQLTGQRRLCDQLLEQKDQVVRRLEAELRCMDDEYNLELTTHGQVNRWTGGGVKLFSSSLVGGGQGH